MLRASDWVCASALKYAAWEKDVPPAQVLQDGAEQHEGNSWQFGCQTLVRPSAPMLLESLAYAFHSGSNRE
jgi:hypothetical protein